LALFYIPFHPTPQHILSTLICVFIVIISSYTILNNINYKLKLSRKSLAIGAIHYTFENHNQFDRCDYLTQALVFTTVGEKQHGSVRKSCALLLPSMYYMKFVVNERHTLV
jgi:hypothetical protein